MNWSSVFFLPFIWMRRRRRSYRSLTLVAFQMAAPLERGTIRLVRRFTATERVRRWSRAVERVLWWPFFDEVPR